ncbi:hypothetical protein PFICI_03157 [Pestalotiopsis fici W106-1]|uniref:Heterokaryon incompatibility domain-containing protein n=1 Tax=Pestalotiopsis fici (strain W106-1 / CGMCC3.15140) TaxID=1229662 RepID=W3XI61_PESFW|nr:uncharacterized protein PFICI_03157 [Pestalotiopsis fici W106-1]ETS85132.1 hypothetical protein PFICI_03157 [Pestalotiopsis fici W106-1]
MATHSGSLCYQMLETGDIRILRILPRTGSCLECELDHVALSQAPDYLAISYAWGDADERTTIIVDGHKFDINTSLYDVLSMLQSESDGEIVTLWADAICINQSNIAERSSQVAIMADIYRQAKYTAAWLGPATQSDYMAIELVQHLVKVKNSEPDFKESMRSPSWHEHFVALASLFNKEYWRRMWILQEVHSGQFVRIYYGTRWLPWENYRDVSRAFRRHDLDVRGTFMREGLEGTGEYISWVLCYNGPNTLDLEEEEELLGFLAWCQPKRCADPKDKLYALLGVLPEAIRRHFKPDYTISVKKLYMDIFEYILRSTRRLDVLCYATIIGMTTENPHFLPSWIPDWSRELQVDVVMDICDCAASSEPADFTISSGASNTSLRGWQMKVKAVFLGRIAQVGLHVPDFHTGDDISMAFLSWRALVKQLGRSDEREVLCRTITMGTVDDLTSQELTDICFHVFVQRLQFTLPSITLDDELKAYSQTRLGASEEELSAFWSKYIERTCEMRRLFVSEEGQVGLGPPNIGYGDLICVPLGCRAPIILRPYSDGSYKFVSDAYVDGYMYGKADAEWKGGSKKLQSYILR